MKKYQSKVLVEHSELSEKIGSLMMFLSKTPDVSETQLMLMKEQLTAMLEYQRVLTARITDFGIGV